MDNDTKELIGMLIILTIIISGVQLLLVRFVHWSAALITTGTIALVVAWLYVSLKHATPNGGSNGPDGSEYIMPAFITFACLLCGLALVCHLTQNRLPKLAFILPLGFMLLFTIGRYVYKYIDGASFYYNHFSSCKIELVNKSGRESVIEQISFKNTSNGFTTNIHPNSKEEIYPNITRFVDKIIFRNYPSGKNPSFYKEFPLNYNLFKEKKGPRIGYIFWLRHKIVLPMKIVLLPENKVDLYLDNHLVVQYELNNQDVLNKEKVN